MFAWPQEREKKRARYTHRFHARNRLHFRSHSCVSFSLPLVTDFRCREVILQSIEPSKIKMIGLPLSIEKFLTSRSDIDDTSEPSNRNNFHTSNGLIVSDPFNRLCDYQDHIHSSNYSNDFLCKPYKIRSFSLTDL